MQKKYVGAKCWGLTCHQEEFKNSHPEGSRKALKALREKGYQRMVGRESWSKQSKALLVVLGGENETARSIENLRLPLWEFTSFQSLPTGCRRELDINWLAQWLPGFNLKSLRYSQDCVTGSLQSCVRLPIHPFLEHSPIVVGRP